MIKVSTLVYSIQNLASHATNDIIDTELLKTPDFLVEIESLLEVSNLFDVRQEVVDKILSEASII